MNQGDAVRVAVSVRELDLERLLRVKPNAWGYNRAILFLGDINTGTWSSRLGESQI
jgi:endonuclease/exonuclease/phosphatase (EEP) superfamily protein YafD